MEVSGDSLFINVSVPEAKITIDDSNEGECGKPLDSNIYSQALLVLLCKCLGKGIGILFLYVHVGV